jgi:hypothetical protein
VPNPPKHKVGNVSVSYAENDRVDQTGYSDGELTLKLVWSNMTSARRNVLLPCKLPCWVSKGPSWNVPMRLGCS